MRGESRVAAAAAGAAASEHPALAIWLFSSLLAWLDDLWPTLWLRFPGCGREEMRETKLSTRPDGNYYLVVQGIIISLMQYVPSFSDTLSSSRLLFPSPDFPGCYSLLCLRCQQLLQALTALPKPSQYSSNALQCCQDVLQEPNEQSKMRYQGNGLCTG